VVNSWTLFAISTGYVAILFAIAYIGDRRARLSGPPARKPWIYSLALCVYCTSWTFYGAVGRAASSGWDFLPIYLGPVIVFLFGGPLLSRVIRISKRHNITSIADFIGARYGRHQPVAMLVTVIAVIGVLPYIALQLKSVAFGFEVLVGLPQDVPHLPDSALAIAMMLAAFAILFGTRDLVSTENHHGMLLAIAFESLVKLAAFLAVGLYAVYVLRDGLADAYQHALALPQTANAMDDASWRAGFFVQTLLAAIAVICLPRQFHVTVVENTALSDLRTSRWVFPLYLAVISVFVLPIAASGSEHFASGAVPGDTFVLALPLAGNNAALALGAYLGGFSAATGMVIVETIALSTMICNEIVVPMLLRPGRVGRTPGQDLSGFIKLVRRVAIVLLIALAYAYFRLFTGPGTLAEIGLLSFAAVAQFAPSLVGGVLWRGGRYRGVVASLSVGFLAWAYTLLLPAILRANGQQLEVLEHGPLGLGWLRPEALFGTPAGDPLMHGVMWSLTLNVICYVGVSLLRAPGLRERLQGAKFLEEAVGESSPGRSLPRSSATVGDLTELIERFLGPDRALRRLLRAQQHREPRPAGPCQSRARALCRAPAGRRPRHVERTPGAGDHPEGPRHAGGGRRAPPRRNLARDPVQPRTAARRPRESLARRQRARCQLVPGRLEPALRAAVRLSARDGDRRPARRGPHPLQRQPRLAHGARARRCHRATAGLYAGRTPALARARVAERESARDRRQSDAGRRLRHQLFRCHRAQSRAARAAGSQRNAGDQGDAAHTGAYATQ